MEDCGTLCVSYTGNLKVKHIILPRSYLQTSSMLGRMFYNNILSSKYDYIDFYSYFCNL
jgi:hypothetical protein